MFSVGARPHAADFDDHLWSIRRQALSQGIRWFWVANLLGCLLLLVRFYVYQHAELIMDNRLPWRYEWQLWAMMAGNIVYPHYCTSPVESGCAHCRAMRCFGAPVGRWWVMPPPSPR